MAKIAPNTNRPITITAAFGVVASGRIYKNTDRQSGTISSIQAHRAASWIRALEPRVVARKILWALPCTKP